MVGVHIPYESLPSVVLRNLASDLGASASPETRAGVEVRLREVARRVEMLEHTILSAVGAKVALGSGVVE